MRKIALFAVFCFINAAAVHAIPHSEIKLERGVYACSKCGGSYITCTCKKK